MTMSPSSVFLSPFLKVISFFYFSYIYLDRSIFEISKIASQKASAVFMSQFGPKLKLCFELLILVPSSPHIRRFEISLKKRKMQTKEEKRQDCKILAKICRLELFPFVSSVIDKSWETERLQPLYFFFLMRWWGWGWWQWPWWLWWIWWWCRQ